MVASFNLLCFAVLALGVLGSKRHKAQIQVSASNQCSGPRHFEAHDITEGKCNKAHKRERNFLSYQVSHGKHWNRQSQLWAQSPCRLHVYQDKGCAGPSLVSKDIGSNFGLCQNATFKASPDGITGGVSYKLVCKPLPPKGRPSSRPSHVVVTYPLPDASTITVSATITNASTIPASTMTVVLSPVPPSSTTVVQAPPSISTVTSSLSSSSVVPSVTTITLSASSSSAAAPQTAYVKTTTTMIAQPAITIEGTTTVWVKAKSSSHKIRTDTYVVTYSDARNARRDGQQPTNTADAKSTAITGRPVVRRDANTIECYASVDGHWIVSTCVLPSSTAN